MIRLESKECVECGFQMQGICDYTIRTVCEPCGGNKTEFSKYNPWPGKKEIKKDACSA